MSGALAGAGLVLVPEDDDLLALSVTHDLAGDLRLRRVLHALAIRQEQNVAEDDFLPGITVDGGHGEERPLFDPVLLPAGADDCVHGSVDHPYRKSRRVRPTRRSQSIPGQLNGARPGPAKPVPAARIRR